MLLQANVVHHLPLVSKKELRAILTAIHDFTVKGELWNIHKWNAALNKTLDEFFWTNPDWSPPGIALKIEEIKEPEVMFSSLEASPLAGPSYTTQPLFNAQDFQHGKLGC